MAFPGSTCSPEVVLLIKIANTFPHVEVELAVLFSFTSFFAFRMSYHFQLAVALINVKAFHRYQSFLWDWSEVYITHLRVIDPFQSL